MSEVARTTWFVNSIYFHHSAQVVLVFLTEYHVIQILTVNYLIYIEEIVERETIVKSVVPYTNDIPWK